MILSLALEAPCEVRRLRRGAKPLGGSDVLGVRRLWRLRRGAKPGRRCFRAVGALEPQPPA
eukprot:8918835-Alexandrium_andersonii.AAC.1